MFIHCELNELSVPVHQGIERKCTILSLDLESEDGSSPNTELSQENLALEHFADSDVQGFPRLDLKPQAGKVD